MSVSEQAQEALKWALDRYAQMDSVDCRNPVEVGLALGDLADSIVDLAKVVAALAAEKEGK